MSLPNTNSKKDYTAISIKDGNSGISYPPSSKLFCNLCNCKLILFDVQMEEWYCNRCNVSYFPNKGERIKRANKFETPGPNTDIPSANITRLTDDEDSVGLCLYRDSKFFWLNGSVYSVYRLSSGL
jgi:hypothetical protein